MLARSDALDYRREPDVWQFTTVALNRGIFRDVGRFNSSIVTDGRRAECRVGMLPAMLNIRHDIS